jgi:hypothetical protein
MRLPSLKQLVDRLRDTSDEGLVDGHRYVAFFSNLNVASEDELGLLMDHFFTYKSGHADAVQNIVGSMTVLATSVRRSLLPY